MKSKHKKLKQKRAELAILITRKAFKTYNAYVTASCIVNALYPMMVANRDKFIAAFTKRVSAPLYHLTDDGYETLMMAKYTNQPIEIHLLIPARTDTTYFHEYIYPYAKLDFIKGRLKFRDLTGVSKKPTSAPFPSIVCIYKHA